MNKMIRTLLVLMSVIPMGLSQANAQNSTQVKTIELGTETTELLQALLGFSGGGETEVQECIIKFWKAKVSIKSATLKTEKSLQYEGGVGYVYSIIAKSSDGNKKKMEITLGEGGNHCQIFTIKDISKM